MRLVSLFFPLAVHLATATAAGAASLQDVTIRYRAPTVCPSEAEFKRRLDERVLATPQLHIDGAPEFEVAIERSGERFQGILIERDATGTEAARKIEGGKCKDVSDALEFLIALSLGLTASEENSTSPDAEQSAEPTAPEVAPEPIIRERIVTRRVLVKDSLALSGGTAIALRSDLAPGIRLVSRLYVEAASRGQGPALRVAAEYGFAQQEQQQIGAVSNWDRVLLQVDACPLAVAASEFSVRPCLMLELGRMVAASEGVQNPVRAADFWLAPGLLGRLEFRGLKPLTFGADVGALLPLTPKRYVLSESIELFETPTVGFFAGVLVGLQLN